MLAAPGLPWSEHLAWQVLCVCLAMLIGVPLAAQVLQGQEPVRVEGRVTNQAGDVPNSDVKVRVVTEDGQVLAEQIASSEGAFYFDGLHKESCVLIVTADGFEKYQEHMDLAHGGTLFMKNIMLHAAAKLGRPAPEGPRSDSLAPRAARKQFAAAANDLGRGDLDGARGHLLKAVKKYPCYARAQNDLAKVLEQKGDTSAAETALKQAIKCDADYIVPYFQLAQMLNGERRFADSASVLEEGIRRSPDTWQFYYHLGVAYYGLGQISKAEAQYQRVKELNPSPPPELHCQLADVYLHEKAYDRAYAQMGDYLKEDPNGRLAAKIKNIMQEMRSAGILTQPEAARK